MRVLILTLAVAVAAGTASAADRKVEEAMARAQAQLDKGNVDEAVKQIQKVANQGIDGQLAVATIQWRAGQVEEAAAAFAKVRELAGTATGVQKADAMAALAGYELAAGSGARALEAANQAVAAQPTAGALAAQARAQARAGQAATALQTADRAVQADANSAVAHIARGEALLASGRSADAEAALRKAAELDPKSAVAQTRIAQALLAAGKNVEAEAAARKATDLDPRSGEAFAIHGKAILAADPKKWSDAIAQAQQGAFLTRNGSALVEYEVGRIFEANGNYQQAAASYQRAAQLDTGYTPARLALIQAQVRQNQIDEALAETLKLAQALPGSGEVQLQLGRLHMRKGDWTNAVPALEKAAGALADNAVAHASLGTAYFQNRRPADALRAYKRAVELDPKNLDYRTTYGILLGIDKQHDAGVAELRKVVESPGYKDADAYLNLGWLYRNMQPRRGEESVAAYTKALELDPKNEQAALGLAWAQNYLNNYDAAIKAFQQAAALDPEVAGEAHVGSAWAYLFKKDLAQAKAAFEKAKAAGRNDTKLEENIARLEKGLAIQKADADRAAAAAAAPPAPRVAVQDVGTLCQVAQGARDEGSRRKAMSDLRKFPDADGVNCLIRGLRDPEITVRIAAANSLGAIGAPAKSAIPHLLQAAEPPAPNPNPTAADLAFEAAFSGLANAVREAVRKIQGR